MPRPPSNRAKPAGSRQPASKSRTPRRFVLRSDHITLGQLLKVCGLVSTGGQARLILGDTPARVNSESEARRGRKLVAGDRVELPDGQVWILSAAESAEEGKARA